MFCLFLYGCESTVKTDNEYYFLIKKNSPNFQLLWNQPKVLFPFFKCEKVCKLFFCPYPSLDSSIGSALTMEVVGSNPGKGESFFMIQIEINCVDSLSRVSTQLALSRNSRVWLIFQLLIWLTLFMTCSVTYICHPIPIWNIDGGQKDALLRKTNI